MLKTSYFVPHSPLFISRIGKENTTRLTKTVSSFEKIRGELETKPPETLILLSSHGSSKNDVITFNLHQKYKLDLSEFGDLTTRQTWRPDIETINHLNYTMGKHFSINLISDSALDYGTTIPLHILTENLPAIKIVSITYGELPLAEIFRFGILLESELSKLNKSFSIIATGDLSHRLKEGSPSGYSKRAEDFDKKIIAAFRENSLSSLQTLDVELLKEVGQCSVRSLLMIAGAFEKKKVTQEVYSYENPLGVGYLSGSFELT